MAYSQEIFGNRYISRTREHNPAVHLQTLLDGVAESFDTAYSRTHALGGYSTLRTKKAEYAGTPNLSQAERGMWRVAESYITDKAPLLTSCCLGFQLLKKTDNDSRVCGIFAFEPGDELVYIPVFLINGEVSGHELMYIVSRDQFLPSDEKQVNYLLSRKPLEPGKTELRERSEIPATGGYAPSRMTSGLKLSSYKLGSLDEPPELDPAFTLDALRTIFKEASVSPDVLDSMRWKSVVSDLNLNDLFGMSRKATKLAEAWSKTYPVYGRLLNYALDGQGVDTHLRLWEKKAELAKQLGVRPVVKQSLDAYIKSQIPKQASVVKEEKVAVYSIRHIPLHQFRFMPTALIDQIHRDGYHVVDTRDQTKLAAVVDGKDHGINNPVGPGYYHVFMADGTFKPFFVLRDFDDYDAGCCCYPSSGSFWSESPDDANRWTLLCPETKKVKRRFRQREIWVAERTPDPDWFSKLPKSNASLPESKHDYWERHQNISSFLITPSGEICRGRFEENGENSYYDYSGGTTFSLFASGKSSFYKLESNGYGNDTVIAPAGTVLRRYKDNDDGEKIALGSRQLWMLRLMEGSVPVSVQSRGGPFNEEYIIDNSPVKEKTAALEYLMTEHCLSQGTAEMLLQEADVAPTGFVSRLREKTAFIGEVPRDRISVTFPQKEKGQHDITGLTVDQDLITEEPVESLRSDYVPAEEDTWPGLLSSETDRSGAPPAPNTRDMQLASQAATAGQKDFVSSQMLMSLLREVDDDGVINKYIPIFEKACDTLGRLYMQVLWRTDAFEDRFGRTQLKEFREMLVSLFQQMGDFICYLRQRDIRPSPVLSLDATETETAEIA